MTDNSLQKRNHHVLVLTKHVIHSKVHFTTDHIPTKDWVKIWNSYRLRVAPAGSIVETPRIEQILAGREPHSFETIDCLISPRSSHVHRALYLSYPDAAHSLICI